MDESLSSNQTNVLFQRIQLYFPRFNQQYEKSTSNDDSDPHDIIPISFHMYNTLYETFYRIELQDQYLVQTQSQTKATGITLPGVHGAKKTLDTRVLPEKQKPQIQAEQVIKIRPKLGRGRAGIRCENPQPVADITTTTSKSCKIPTIQNVTKDNTDFPVPEQSITKRDKNNCQEKDTR